MSLDPRYPCRCEFDDNIFEIYNRNLETTCGDPRYADDIHGGFGPEREPNDEQARLFTSD